MFNWWDCGESCERLFFLHFSLLLGNILFIERLRIHTNSLCSCGSLERLNLLFTSSTAHSKVLPLSSARGMGTDFCWELTTIACFSLSKLHSVKRASIKKRSIQQIDQKGQIIHRINLYAFQMVVNARLFEWIMHFEGMLSLFIPTVDKKSLDFSWQIICA